MILPNFVKKVSERILELDKIERISIGSLLSSLEAIWLSLSELDAALATLVKKQRLRIADDDSWSRHYNSDDLQSNFGRACTIC